jgi:hypothetical protein
MLKANVGVAGRYLEEWVCKRNCVDSEDLWRKKEEGSWNRGYRSRCREEEKVLLGSSRAGNDMTSKQLREERVSTIGIQQHNVDSPGS